VWAKSIQEFDSSTGQLILCHSRHIAFVIRYLGLFSLFFFPNNLIREMIEYHPKTQFFTTLSMWQGGLLP
jgi:hypothetical protein